MISTSRVRFYKASSVDMAPATFFYAEPSRTEPRQGKRSPPMHIFSEYDTVWQKVICNIASAEWEYLKLFW